MRAISEGSESQQMCQERSNRRVRGTEGDGRTKDWDYWSDKADEIYGSKGYTGSGRIHAQITVFAYFIFLMIKTSVLSVRNDIHGKCS